MSGPEAVAVTVAVHTDGLDLRAGTAFIQERRGAVSTTFTYDSDFQSDHRGFAISPDLPLSSARHHVAGLPGTFSDSAPDRWGRNLIDKRARGQARQAGRPVRSVGEVDYLLGVSDLTRQGALRFAIGDGPFLAAETVVPKLIELPRLLRAADEVSNDSEGGLAAVKTLLDAGTGSLGGARPKASVRDGERLLIAKFPHPGDRWDVMAWEKTVLDLAERSGIPVPVRQLVTVDGRHALLLERFDRDESRRVAYMSALSLVGGRDGGSFDFLEVAEALAALGAAVKTDLAQLWRRIDFSLAINNTDNHLRNHGFLHARGGWLLAPAFDLNPNPDTTAEPVTSVGFATGPRAEQVEALLASAPDFRLTPPAASAIAGAVAAAVRDWRAVATANGISELECDLFADCFAELP
jgi:serine/threonine-protein kinase HipA